MEISHFEVLPFNLHLTFVSCAPRRPILTAEAFRSQKRPAAIDGISAHLSAAVPGWGVRNWPVIFWLDPSLAQCQKDTLKRHNPDLALPRSQNFLGLIQTA